jgi:hypothetical protein
MERPLFDYSSLAAQRAKELAHDSGHQIRETARTQFEHWSTRLRNVIVENPGASLGAALGMGVILGWLIKRR